MWRTKRGEMMKMSISVDKCGRFRRMHVHATLRGASDPMGSGLEAITAGCRPAGFSFPMIVPPSPADDGGLSLGTMSEHPHLGSAPIREALIDFRVRLPSDFSPGDLGRADRGIARRVS